MTPPYFHDGSVATLPEAVKVMARVQLGIALVDADVRELVAFLESLTSELPAEFATVPSAARRHRTEEITVGRAVPRSGGSTEVIRLGAAQSLPLFRLFCTRL